MTNDEVLQDVLNRQKVRLGTLEKLLSERDNELRRLRRIVGCVVRNCRHVDDTTPRDEPGPLCGPAWGKVAYLCGLGSTSAIALCREFDVEPDYDCGRESRDG